MALIKRVSSGVPGLDSLISGGFVSNSANLVTGSTGTGKTILCAQFLWHGLQKGETGVFITLEESPEEIKEDMKLFGWDFEKYEKKGMFRLIYHDPAQVNLGSVMLDEIKGVKAKRLVIDSTAVMGLNVQDLAQIRKMVSNIINTIKRSGCTALIISEVPEESKMLSRFGVEEFLVDSVILMNYLGIGEVSSRSLMIRKMRRTNHGKDVYPTVIGKRGISVKRNEI